MRLDRLNEIDEPRQPAIITFKRGTVSKVDHFRIIKPRRLVIMGTGVPTTGKQFGWKSIVGKLPDFSEGKHRNYKYENVITANVNNILSIKRL